MEAGADCRGRPSRSSSSSRSAVSEKERDPPVPPRADSNNFRRFPPCSFAPPFFLSFPRVVVRQEGRTGSSRLYGRGGISAERETAGGGKWQTVSLFFYFVILIRTFPSRC